MELIFLYINKSITTFIEKQGFNFSSNYYFYVEINDGIYRLKQKLCEKKIPDTFFDKTYCITNITAIVGENGAGKSTLLNNIASFQGSVKDGTHETEYKEHFAEEYEKDKQIAIYKEDGRLICYHNIDTFENTTGIDCRYLFQGSPELMYLVQNNMGFENISKISLTNSMYTQRNSVSTHGSISEISLNVNTLNTLKNMFYKKKCKKVDSCAGGYYEYQDILCSYKKVTDFQQIVDVLYLNYLHENKANSIFADNLKSSLEIKFQSFQKCLDDKFGDILSEHNKEISLQLHYKATKGLLENFDFELLKKDLFCIPYINLLFELITYCRYDTYEGNSSINNKNDLKSYLKRFINMLKEKENDYAAFFLDALDEIEEYEKCLDNCDMLQCLLPINDLAYRTCKKIEYNSKPYFDFLRLIYKSVFIRKTSFVLKYIEIGGLELASGERALLNFFSWLHLVTFFKYLSDDVHESLRDNVLLLIDEIDLYCHPLWQQKILYYLIEELKLQFVGKKVQIIFTTHSPIVLSDMPKGNVIYLKKEEAVNRCRIDEKDKHSETFGASIYKLFNDAFFLGKKGQIGEFASLKIQKIIDTIKPVTNKEEGIKYPQLSEIEVERLEKEIALIGETIIRDKLFTMLYKCKYSGLGVKEKKIRVYEEKIKKLRNGEIE
ncbi:AAA family ATPase [Clostridium sp. KNHs205]|uniref:AAA family ATPase n=1 Tax=Clostridium sp. KNHs205 TaxID=1449050 RepID=UPI00051C8F3E|nr:AAA family ATPase [Clostridium sp. KNHs205]